MTYHTPTTRLAHTLGLLLAGFGLFGVLNTAWAQSIDVNVSPTSPRPLEEVVISFNSGDIDLPRSEVTWYINGQETLSGEGEIIARVTAPALGELMVVEIVVESPRGEIVTRQIELEPAELDILWEANSYTPPLYRGKALPPSGGFVTLSAMPNLTDSTGRIIPPETLTYLWQQNGITLGEASGYAKQRVTLRSHTSATEPTRVTVTATAESGESVTGSVAIPVVDTEVYLYEKTPLEGVNYTRAFADSNDVLVSAITLHAEPFFFSIDDMLERRVKFIWKIQGIEASEGMSFERRSLDLDSLGAKGVLAVTFEALNNNLPLRAFQEVEKMVTFIFK